MVSKLHNNKVFKKHITHYNDVVIPDAAMKGEMKTYCECLKIYGSTLLPYHIDIEEELFTFLLKEVTYCKHDYMFTSLTKDNNPVFIPGGKYDMWLNKDEQNTDYLYGVN